MKWVYFSVWPDETWNFDRTVFTLFHFLTIRVDIPFRDESQFEAFRLGLSRHGLTLREVERVPYHEPEKIG